MLYIFHVVSFAWKSRNWEIENVCWLLFIQVQRLKKDFLGWALFQFPICTLLLLLNPLGPLCLFSWFFDLFFFVLTYLFFLTILKNIKNIFTPFLYLLGFYLFKLIFVNKSILIYYYLKILKLIPIHFIFLIFILFYLVKIFYENILFFVNIKYFIFVHIIYI